MMAGFLHFSTPQKEFSLNRMREHRLHLCSLICTHCTHLAYLSGARIEDFSTNRQCNIKWDVVSSLMERGDNSMNGKRLVIATLFPLVFLTLVFIPLAHQQSVGAYDPWLDNNGDGKVDASDLLALAQAYGSSGDPTRNVNVTNWKALSVLLRKGLNQTLGLGWVPANGWWNSSSASLDGYSEFYLYFRCPTSAEMSGDHVELFLLYKAGGMELQGSSWSRTIPSEHLAGPYDAIGPQMRVAI
jgi:hypothetical protein